MPPHQKNNDSRIFRKRHAGAKINDADVVRVACHLLVLLHQGNKVVELLPGDVLDDKEERLGGGSFGTVTKGMYGGRTVAVKTVMNTAMNRSSRSSCMESGFLQEVFILQQCRHPSVIGIFGVVFADSTCRLVLELATEGSLKDFYNQERYKAVSVKQRVLFLIQIASGMAYLHDTMKIIHGDLKSENVLITKTSPHGPAYAKIADFGLSLQIRELFQVFIGEGGGTRFWKAPEKMSTPSLLHPANDVFSFAVIITEVISGAGPYGRQLPAHRAEIDSHEESIMKEMKSNEGPSRLEQRVFCLQGLQYTGEFLFSVFRICWDVDLTVRPDFRYVTSSLHRIYRSETHQAFSEPPAFNGFVENESNHQSKKVRTSAVEENSDPADIADFIMNLAHCFAEGESKSGGDSRCSAKERMSSVQLDPLEFTVATEYSKAKSAAPTTRKRSRILSGDQLQTWSALLDNGVSFSSTQKNSALHVAVRKGLLKQTEWLLEHGADPNAEVGRLTPLHPATLNGFDEIVDRLLNFKQTVICLL
ncbi:kinase-like domain-containing protein [Zopfochytrium polystomum]|nr:kinase-like domain-containing protein [Zopfochytrium polystomum]